MWCCLLQLELKGLIPRKYHMCCSYFRQDRMADVVVYGGNKRRKNKFERNVMTDMIIIRFGKGALFEKESVIIT